MPSLILEHALLPTGWADDVLVEHEAGSIVRVRPGVRSGTAERIAGVVLPGLPNLHSHTFQRGMAGLAERRGPPGDDAGDNFWTWREVMYRFLERLTPDDVGAIAAQAMVEMLEGGFTSLVEFHYLHHGPGGEPYADPAELAARVAAAAGETGIGLTLLPVFYAHGGFGGAPPSVAQRRFVNDRDGYRELLERSRAAAASLDDAVIGVAPHSLRAVTPEELTAVTEGTADPIHIHVAEQTREVEECLAWSGQRPVAWLLDHVPVDARWCAVHGTHMNPDETARLARSGAVAGLCPITEANLGDGLFDAEGFLAAGGRWGVGSDSNIEIGAAAELRMLEYGQRLLRRGRNLMARAPGASTGRSLYEAALAGGAQASGRPVGAIAEGCRADFVSLSLDHPDLGTVAGDGWLDAYVFAAGREALDEVWVGGRRLVTGGRHVSRDGVRSRFRAAKARLLGAGPS